ncbi:hypothetical protein BJY04DRAFT_208764 [Aspergillus karnatakaensis]|uniref:Zn(II)2Cys6 transcription factor n=1 Tax=Aspergillus karnatakaensis TaxID=1810916 RepID=UPI003CCD5796
MSTNSEPTAPSRRRRRTAHAKSGCRTCKIRRVKCDEVRPSCAKCVTTGRVCDGYGIWEQPPATISLAQKPAGAPQQTLSLNYPLPLLPGLAHEEKRYLDRFQHLVISKLSQPFGSHFWSSIVTQLSMTEPAVVHGCIALASAYESFIPKDGLESVASTVPPGAFMLRQYNRAIRALTTELSSGNPVSLRTAVVSCVLFICLEILRGDLNAMQAHFSSGIKLLRQLQNGDRKVALMDSAVLVKHNAEVLDDHLVDVFTRLNLHFLMLGHGSQLKQTFIPSFLYGRRIQIPRQFYSTREVRQSLTILLLSIIHLIKEAEQLTLDTDIHPPPPSAVMIEKQKALQSALSEWTAAYELSEGRLSTSASTQEKLGLLMLRMYADIFSAFLGTCFSIKETSYDTHTAVFESTIKRYEEVFSIQESTTLNSEFKSNPVFTIDMGFFPPLYSTALKCRNPKIRREALSLLRRFRHMEGPWTGDKVARVAEYVMRLEEAHFEGQSDVVLPEFCRIHCVECKLPDQHSPGANMGSLTMRRFRHELGKEGGWVVMKCEIDLGA